jgi:ribosomal protein S18 acetylase RimI-like enzyme
MKKIDQLQTYTELMKTNHSIHGSIVYNVMLLPQEVQSLIDAQKLFFEVLPEGLAIYRLERDFYKLYLFLAEDKIASIQKLDKPIVLEFIYSERRIDPKVQKLEALCQTMGFDKYVTNKRRTIQLNDALTATQAAELIHQGYEIRRATLPQIGSLVHIWEESLDKYDSIIPKTSELRELIINGEIFCLYQNAMLLGIAKLKKHNHTSSIWMLAIKKSERGKGLAGVLMSGLLGIAHEAGLKSCYIWTDEENRAIESVSMKLNFQPDGIRSVEYIIK